jgi:hypothetical protein
VERIRAAVLRYGFDVQAEEIAMRALGEDPAHFQELLEGLWEEYNPVGASQEGLVIRLARAVWLMNRADRMQEGYAVRQAREVSSGREDRRHAQLMRLKMTEERLRLLAQSVARDYYVTTSADLEKMKNLHQEGVVKEMGEIALALFYRLEDERDKDTDGPEDFERAQRVVAQVKEIFGIGTTEYTSDGNFARNCDPPVVSPPVAGTAQAVQKSPASRFTAAEWDAREEPRQLLENLLTRQMESCKEQRKALLKESVKGPSPYERAAEIAPTHPNARVMRGMQESSFREVRRLTTLLLKIKRYELQREGLARRNEKKGPSAPRYVRRKRG